MTGWRGDGPWDGAPGAPATALAPRVTSARVRTVLLYAQDNQGLGHINRTLVIARHLLAAHPNLVAYIATKSAIAGHFALPPRCDYIKLPGRLTPPTMLQTSEEAEAARQHFRAIRGRLLRDAALGLAPDLVLVDHEPVGSAGEFRDGLYALKAERPRTKFVCGLRDVADHPHRTRARWRDLGVYDAFQDLYDGIAVYGCPTVYDVARAYDIPASVLSKVHYCGYVAREAPSVDANLLRRRHGLPDQGRLVVATVGSGSDGYPVLEATRAALERLHIRDPDLLAILVTGPFMPSVQQARLRAGETALCRVLDRADTLGLMAAADAIVTMGGYNSVCEALAVGRPLVIVPRATHKVEQQIRAEALAARGLARWVHPDALDPPVLAEALEWALTCDRRDHDRRVREVIPQFDGAARLTAYLAPWLDDC